MTPELKKELEKKIKEADEIENRIKYLTDARKQLLEGKIKAIVLTRQEVEPQVIEFRLFYSEILNQNGSPAGHSPVCWQNKESDFTCKIWSDILIEIDGRISEAEKSYGELT